jgi:hypothetical protein
VRYRGELPICVFVKVRNISCTQLYVGPRFRTAARILKGGYCASAAAAVADDNYDYVVPIRSLFMKLTAV